MIDQGTAEDQGWAIGDRIRAAAEGPPRSSPSRASRGWVTSSRSAAPTLAVFDVSTAQRLLDKEGQLDTIFLASDEGSRPRS